MIMKRYYGEISKSEEQDDGTIKVWGYASTGNVDADGETVTAEAMKAAIPDYMKWGAVREMHQPRAAGTAIEASVLDDGRTFFGAHIVDSEAVKKVKTSVYKGFSIGGKVTSRDDLNKSVIKGLRLVEVSLVDRPANPEAVITIMKVDDAESTEQVGESQAGGIVQPAAPVGGISAEKAEGAAALLAQAAVTAIDELAKMLDDKAITPERLVELAKRDQVKPEPLPEILTKWQGEEVMDASVALQTLDALLYLLIKESNEPTEPIEQVNALRTAIAAIKAFVASEILEENADKLAKAGAKFSKATKDSLSKVHAGMKECCEHLDKLGYANDEEKADETGDLAKVDEAINKAFGDAGALPGDNKVEFIKKLADERDQLAKRVKELEAMPMPGKALLKAIAKGDDVHVMGAVEDFPPVKDSTGGVNEAATLIKKLHHTGGQRFSV